MEDWLPNLLAPVIAAVIAAYIGYIQGRWSKHKEIIYEKKVVIYTDLVSGLLEFVNLCVPKNGITTKEYGEVIAAFTETQNAFFRASLFMPEQLYKDIRNKFSPANDRLAKIYTAFDRMSKIKNGAKEKDLGVKDFPEFKEPTIGALEDMRNFPGPFMPLVEAAPSIVLMLKKDLGIGVLDAKFYTKRP